MVETRLYELADRVLYNTLTVEEGRELDVWLSESPENQATWDDILVIWGATDNFWDTVDPQTDTEWAKLNATISQMPTVTAPNPYKPPFWRNTRVWAMAATVTLLAIVGIFLLQSRGEKNNPEDLRFYAAAGEQKKIDLSDGSHIVLNGNSELVATAGFGSQHRKLTLKGEAFFDVAKDPGKPFVVTTGKTTAEALGTAFNVRQNKNDQIQLSVEEGRVRFTETAQQKNMVLVAGEVAIYDPKTNSLNKQQETAQEQAAWRHGQLVFHDTPFPQTAEQLERHYGVTLHFPERLNDARLNATFDKKPLADVLDVLKALYNVKATQNGKEVRLSE